jgi:REP element-mobilizing transposase RayT
LRRPEAAAAVVRGWKRFGCERYDLIAWVVMPNHVHVLIRAYSGVPLAKIVQSWKSYSAREIQALAGAPLGAPSTSSANLPPPTPTSIWQRDYWDRYIRDEKHFAAVVEYIHQNPVKAGLVRRPEDWAWSSAREYAGESFAELGFGLPVQGGGADTAGSEGVRLGEDAELVLGAPRGGAHRGPRDT